MRDDGFPSQRGADESATEDRGQSEVIGYVAIFTLVVLLVAVVSTMGYSQIRDVRTTERADAAVLTVERFAGAVESLLRGDARERDVAIELGDGSVSAGHPVTVTVSGHEVGAPDENFSQTVRLRTLVVQTANARIRYAAGAVVRVESAGRAVMVREPPGVLSTPRTMLPLIDTRLRGGEIGGRSTVLLRATRPASGGRLLRYNTTAYELTVSIESQQPDVWKRYLEDELDQSCSVAGDTVTCSYPTERLSILSARIDVSIIK